MAVKIVVVVVLVLAAFAAWESVLGARRLRARGGEGQDDLSGADAPEPAGRSAGSTRLGRSGSRRTGTATPVRRRWSCSPHPAVTTGRTAWSGTSAARRRPMDPVRQGSALGQIDDGALTGLARGASPAVHPLPESAQRE